MTDDAPELPPEKIRAVSPKLPEDVWHAEPEQLQQLRDDIAALARAENDEVFFYEPIENDAYDYVKGSALTTRAQIANLRHTLLLAARESGSDGDVLVQAQDLKKGTLTLLCPPHFVTEIEAMEDAPAVAFLPQSAAPAPKSAKNTKGFKP
jgi:hypothetical protein